MNIIIVGGLIILDLFVFMKIIKLLLIIMNYMVVVVLFMIKML